jgi:hypothetical protein
MKFQIGAMSVGDILDRGLKLLLARLPTFYAINLIVLAPTLAGQLALPALVQAALAGESGLSQMLAISVGSLLLSLLTLILQPIATGGILHVIAQGFVDVRVGLGAALGIALRRFGKLLITSLLAGLITAVGFFLCIVPYFIFMVWYIFIAQIVVVEDLWGPTALARSQELTAGYRWRVFGLLLLFVLIGLIFVGVVSLMNRFLPATERVPTGSGAGPAEFTLIYIYPNYVIQTLVSQLLGILVGTFQAICMTLLYYDLRIRKEGFDLELAARLQAPSTT